MLNAFHHRTFTVLWTGILLYRVGFWMGFITLQWLVARATDNSPLALGLLAFFNLIPMLIITPLGGAAADRLDRGRIIVVTQYLMGAAAAVLAFLVTTGRADSVTVLYGFAVLFGVGLSFNAPANQAAIANSVPREELRSAISLNAIGLNLSRIGGPLVAGFLLLTWGAGASFWAWAAVCVVAAAAISRMPFRPYEPERDSLGVIARIKQGFDHLRERPPALLALVFVAAMTVFGTSYSAIIAVVAYDTLNGGDAVFSLLLTCSGLGSMFGAVVAGSGRLGVDLSRLATWTLVYGLVQIAFGLSTWLWVSLPLIAVLGGFNFFVMTSLNVLIQGLTEEAKRGRSMSLFMLAWGGLYPIGALAIGFLGELITIPYALAIFALALMGASLWMRSAAKAISPARAGGRF